MSIAQGTTYYDYPQVQLTDRPTFADFNPAFADIDAKLYGLITGAITDEQAIADLGTAVGNLRTDLGSVNDTATAAKNKADANEEAITFLSTQVSQNTTKLGTKIDSNAIAEPYNTSATYSVDDVVTYQGQRYRCIAAVTEAEPFDATKWTGEDVQTVLDGLSTPAAANVTLSPITGMTADDVQEGIAELKSDLPTSDVIAITTSNTGVVQSALKYGKICTITMNASTITATERAEVQIGTITNAVDRPPTTIFAPVSSLSGNTGLARVKADGTITVAPMDVAWTSQAVYFNITYIVS